ncbi:MAG: protein translocase subunit SecD [Patescibacteria group bacterium]
MGNIYKILLKPFEYFWNGLGLIFRFLFMPNGEKQKAGYILTIVIIVSFFAFALDFPSYWDKSVDYLNVKYAKNIPHFKNIPFSLGLDLQGGAHLVYLADMSAVANSDKKDSLEGMRDVIDRRVNLFGISEPIVQTSQSSGEYKIIVELAGVKDLSSAIKMIGDTPFLEFKEERAQAESEAILKAREEGKRLFEDPYYIPSNLNGKYLENSELTFDQNTNAPVVNIYFNNDGSKLFEELTKKNVGKTVAIYLDGSPISAPRVNEIISGGRAVITGDFTVEEAKLLVGRMKSGALPVPIKLVSQQTIEASLGEQDLSKSLKAGTYAFLLVCIFMILWYRIPGILAVISLVMYSVLLIAIFKLLPVTLTLSGIAGFILSIGMAVDANVLIFARMKEEFKRGKSFSLVIDDSFKRAWPSIRDSNLSTLITCAILYIFTTSLIKGFALTLALGVLVSMFSAVFITRLLLKIFSGLKLERGKFLWYK